MATLPLQAGATFTAGGGGAAGAAAFSNPITAALAAAALATAYGTSPTVRKKANSLAHKGWESISNPFQHFGDGSDKDRFGNLLNGQLDTGFGKVDLRGSLLKSMGQGQQQKQNSQNQAPFITPFMGGGGGGFSNDIAGLNAPVARPSAPRPSFTSPFLQAPNSNNPQAGFQPQMSGQMPMAPGMGQMGVFDKYNKIANKLSPFIEALRNQNQGPY